MSWQGDASYRFCHKVALLCIAEFLVEEEVMYKAAIFDMDGLLLDSERVHMECFMELCQERRYKVTFDDYKPSIGISVKDVKAILPTILNQAIDVDEFFEAWDEKCFAVTKGPGVPVKPGVYDLLSHIHRLKIPLSVATSTQYEKAQYKLEKSGIKKFFNFIIGGDQVPSAKPSPDIYIASAERHGLAVNECIAFEDSEHGVMAAHRAGIRVIQVPDLIEPSESLKSLGHKIVSSLEDIHWHQL